jgi:glucosamine 6-phosphate synthetase-like amidotransferase/phosphosugar isomerase protein
MVGEGLRVAIWLDKDHLEHEDLLLAADLRELGAKVLLIGQRASETTRDLLLEVPHIDSEWQFVVDIMPMQIAAERLAVRAGRDCDSFRLCSYVVTDEGGLSAKRRFEHETGDATK